MSRTDTELVGQGYLLGQGHIGRSHHRQGPCGRQKTTCLLLDAAFRGDVASPVIGIIVHRPDPLFGLVLTRRFAID